ncbi:peptidase T [Agriterribacter sp.]|uniref:peptidase T n=1 Tax=Agriterribacter sp. TaxID=2821509 RepID=UPI002D80F477|nr:peptidase T [Agriterribacter sp.]
MTYKPNAMFSDYDFTVTDRFMRYVQTDTQSDPQSASFPSTEKQKNLSRLLVKELGEMGITGAELDEHGYVYATLPSNTGKKAPVICFCSHVDTSPDCTGKGVKPLLHRNYNGKDIVLPDDAAQVIRVADHPYLQQKKGEDIITASGTTLLGADDKAGVAVIMDMVHFFTTNPEVKHGTIKILFTPDEEIGRGVDKVDLKKLGADFGYTLDAGERGVFEDETFSADSVTITFNGVSAHPGYAKGKMVNAIKVASAFIASLPQDWLSPETTEGREGFVHPVHINGIAEKVSIQFILRDFITAKLQEYASLLQQKADETLAHFTGVTATLEIKEQYRNMKEILNSHPKVSAYAIEAIQRAGIEPVLSSARGGTDGSRLSFMGLPCPNLFTGEMAFHSKHEYVSVQDMQKSVETIVHLAMIWEEKG